MIQEVDDRIYEQRGKQLNRELASYLLQIRQQEDP